MPHVRRPLPAGLPGPVFTAAEARACGVTPGRLCAPDLQRLRRGLYARTDLPHTDLHIVQALTRQYPRTVAIGVTAAALYRYPLPRSVAGRPLLLATAGRSHLTSDTVVRWRRLGLPADEIRTASGIWLTTHPRTWADLGECLQLWELVIIGDHLVRIPRPQHDKRRSPLATLDQLSDAADRSMRAARKLRRARALIRIGSDSPRETVLRLRCMEAGLPEPSLNPKLPVPESHRMHEPDLYWDEFKVSAQYDGLTHRTAEQHDKDVHRAERARQMGLLEVVITQSDMHEGGRSAVHRIRAALRERGYEDPAAS